MRTERPATGSPMPYRPQCACPSPNMMRTSRVLSPTTARNRSSGCFVFWILRPGGVQAERGSR
jgi:hypothetical protein